MVIDTINNMNGLLSKRNFSPRFIRIVVLFTVAIGILKFCLYFSTAGPTTHTVVTDEHLLEYQKAMLSGVSLARLSEITSGTLSRENIEIVLSRHNEDIGWSSMYSSIRTVYDKSNESNLLPLSTAGKVIRLPNLGRESHTYLWHIVKNYDTLAANTVFSQASAPQHGYAGHRKGGGHLMANSSFHDFVLSENGHFTFTGAVWLPTLAHLLRSGYNRLGASRWQALRSCPTPMMSDANGSEYRFDLDDKNHLNLLKHIASRCTTEASKSCSGYSFWDTFIKLPRPRADILFFAQGATFSATKEQIRRRPLEDYKQLLAEVSKSEDPSAGFFLEWMWHYVLTSDVSPCPVSGGEFDWAKVQPFYKSLPFDERVKFTSEAVTELLKKRKRAKPSTSFFY